MEDKYKDNLIDAEYTIEASDNTDNEPTNDELKEIEDESKDLIIENDNIAHDITSESQFFIDISKSGRLLTAEEELELAKRCKEGDRSAFETLVIKNMRLVASIASKYQYRGMEKMDLIQEGTIGLVTAINRFDYTKGYRLTTYATWWIKQSMMRAVDDKADIIKKPVHIAEKIRKIKAVRISLLNELMRDPTIKEIAEASDIEERKVIELLRYSEAPTSLDLEVV